MINVGLLGCGNIGRIIAKGQDNFKITAVYDTAEAKVNAFGKEFGAVPYTDFASFLKES
ncbi:MAG TPA: Gfo/Idh/MocA family oxidoreductase [Methanocorpusculum sp.]|nr:Gfo/Idh/MocA family oxidoreductase [Methanocorpusculum sp.]